MSPEHWQCEDLPHVDRPLVDEAAVSTSVDGVLLVVFNVRYSVQYPAKEAEAEHLAAADNPREWGCYDLYGPCEDRG